MAAPEGVTVAFGGDLEVISQMRKALLITASSGGAAESLMVLTPEGDVYDEIEYNLLRGCRN